MGGHYIRLPSNEQGMEPTRYFELRDQVFRTVTPSVFAPVVLRDAESNYVPIPICERLVQAIWYDQRFQAEKLTTMDGRPVRVLFPGWWNLEAGPDFRNATVQIGDDPELSGDVEIHLRADDWFRHGHNEDPNYNNVVLHVVLWEAGSDALPHTQAGDITPQVVLQHHLDTPLEVLYDELDLDAYPHNVGNHQGPCAALLAAAPPGVIQELLDSAGDERFAAKMRKYARWTHRVGAAQAFYEGWMEGLGYKANKTAFRTLAQRLPLHEIVQHRTELAALLFGVANFLPTDKPSGTDATSQQYVKRLWSQWWKLRPDFADRVCRAETWRTASIRPANHPHRRIGAAVALLKRHQNFAEKAIAAIESDGDPAKLFLQARDEYWAQHFTLGGKAQAKPSELIGEARAAEIVANIVLPFVAAQADKAGDSRLLERVLKRQRTAKAQASNSTLRLAAAQLFGNMSTARPFLDTARRQQGLMQIFQDFCVHDKSICRTCQFPEMVHLWTEGTGLANALSSRP